MPLRKSLANCKSRPKDFADLPPSQRRIARIHLWRALHKWKDDLPKWRYALLCAAARQQAKYPKDSAWGAKMRRIRAGKAAVRVNRANGYPNVKAHVANAARRREAKEKAAAREKLGLPPAARSGFTAGNAPD